MRIHYTDFPYAKFNALEESNFEEKCGFQVLLTSQEYKGTICVCTLFVGKLLYNQDLRDTTTLPVATTLEQIASANLSEEERKRLDEACEELKSKLALDEDDSFGEYGLALLVRCW